MPRTLRMIPDAGCTDLFHIQRTQKPGSKESGFLTLLFRSYHLVFAMRSL